MTNRSDLLRILSFIDLTSLEATDHPNTLKSLITKANSGFNGVLPAAICVYPNLAATLASQLNKNIKLAVVAGAFPSGQTFSEIKVAEVAYISLMPVHEIDIVINRGALMHGNDQMVFDEVLAMRKACPHQKLKVIIESGELKTPELIERASLLAVEAGADFIKTSTGKTSVGATSEAAVIMCQVILNHYRATGKKIGFKPSGGIRQIDQALSYMNTVKSILGDEWLTPELFRIGASSLYDTLIQELQHAN